MIKSRIIKKIGYRVLDIITMGRGIPVKINGFRMKLPTYYFRLFPQDYEKSNFKYIQETVKEGDYVFDIGAHIGLLAVLLGKTVKASGKVYSFEPTPISYGLLCKTIRINDLEKTVTPVQAAVSDTSGRTTFYISDTAIDVGNSLVQYGDDKVVRGIELEMTSIDDFMEKEKVTKMDFMKIDAEGAEYKVLKGGVKTLAKYKPKIILALHPEAIEANKDSLEIIFDLLENLGYKIVYKGTEMDKAMFCAKTNLFDVHLLPTPSIGR